MLNVDTVQNNILSFLKIMSMKFGFSLNVVKISLKMDES